MSRIRGTIVVDGNRIIFTPDIPMRSGATIYVTSTTGLQSVLGNHLFHEDLYHFYIDNSYVLIPVSKKDFYIRSFDSTTYNDSDDYGDIKFFWRGTGVVDPNTFEVTHVIPLNDSTSVEITTITELTFSEKYDKSTATEDNIYMEEEDYG